MVARIATGMLALAIVAAAPPPPLPSIAIARIGSTIDGAELVGTKRAGTLCLPNGAIRWSEVADLTGMDQRELAEDAFEDAGLPVTPLGIGTDHTARLRGTVKAAHFSMCARHWLGGGSKAVSGNASLDIEWRLERADGTPPVAHTSHISHPVDPAHAAPLGAIYRLLISDAAKDAVDWIKAGAAPDK